MPRTPALVEYRSWAELAEAAKSDTRAFLYLLEDAPWATKLLAPKPVRPPMSGGAPRPR